MDDADQIAPAHLDFLAIFSPDLGQTEKTEKDQIVFYWSKPVKRRKKKQDPEQLAKRASEEENERMRQIGLAQGMVHFARTFGGGKDVDAIDTERHRIVLRQLETGWWILASICLTRIPAHLTSNRSSDTADEQPLFEYSSREVSPPILLEEQLQRAHRIFLLHHGQNLSDLYVRLTRSKFCGILEKFWDPFAKTWEVLLHENPIADAYPAIKLSAAGELGVGVGEEDWGSGEREAIEGIIRDTEGIRDLVVVRSDPHSITQSFEGSKQNTLDLVQWHARNTSQGVIFTGVGYLGRKSVRTIAEWTGVIAEDGRNAYGVQQNPASTRSRVKKTASAARTRVPVADYGEGDDAGVEAAKAGKPQQQGISTFKPAIPPSVVSVIEESLNRATSTAETPTTSKPAAGTSAESATGPRKRMSSMDWGKYFKLGYGSAWGPTSDSKPVKDTEDTFGSEDRAQPQQQQEHAQRTNGHFLVGFTGGLEETEQDATDEEGYVGDEIGSRISLRTVHVELSDDAIISSEDRYGSGEDDRSPSRSPSPRTRGPTKFKRLRVIVYQALPFVYTFIVEPTTPSLAIPSFYKTLHKQLQALHKPLEASTSARRVMERLLSSMPNRSDKSPIHDLMFDHTKLTLRTSIPNIPPAIGDSLELPSQPGPWTRLEALNVHAQAIACIAEARSSGEVRESSAKTQRNWWIIWMQQRTSTERDLNLGRMSSMMGIDSTQPTREAILVRKSADEKSQSEHRRESNSFGRLSISSTPAAFGGLGRFLGRENGSDEANNASTDTGTTWSASRVAEGMGIDPGKYMESLFNLNR